MATGTDVRAAAASADGPQASRVATLRAARHRPRAPYLSDRGRLIHGPTPPGGSIPAERTADLTAAELDEIVNLIATHRLERTPLTLPDRLRARSWASVTEVLLRLDRALGWRGAGWKVGAASMEVRRAENIPSPSPGRIFEHAIFASPAEIGSEYFVNYRLCECEFAFRLALDFPAREQPYTEADLRAGVDCLLPVIEIGDSVFEDWYTLSGYFGGMYDNGGGAALVEGPQCRDWTQLDLPAAGIDLYVNDSYVKSGTGDAAMGHPITSLTWMVNWVRERGHDVHAGEVVSTGTCTAHCFAAVGDLVSADFGDLGLVEVRFVD